jgi:hypothetical protein
MTMTIFPVLSSEKRNRVLDEKIIAADAAISSFDARLSELEPLMHEWNQTDISPNSDMSAVYEYISLADVASQRSVLLKRVTDLRLERMALMKKRHPRALDPRYFDSDTRRRNMSLRLFFLFTLAVVIVVVSAQFAQFSTTYQRFAISSKECVRSLFRYREAFLWQPYF